MPIGETELTSWKQIAHHLRVNIRTAQHWERERSLPVRRLPGARGRVLANTAALDAWQEATKTDTNTAKTGQSCYRWPLSTTTTVELRILGEPLTTRHLDRIQQYLDLVRLSLHNK